MAIRVDTEAVVKVKVDLSGFVQADRDDLAIDMWGLDAHSSAAALLEKYWVIPK